MTVHSPEKLQAQCWCEREKTSGNLGHCRGTETNLGLECPGVSRSLDGLIFWGMKKVCRMRDIGHLIFELIGELVELHLNWGTRPCLEDLHKGTARV